MDSPMDLCVHGPKYVAYVNSFMNHVQVEVYFDNPETSNLQDLQNALRDVATCVTRTPRETLPSSAQDLLGEPNAQPGS